MHAEPRRKGDYQSLTDGTLTEAEARLMLERMRWPNGIVCPRPDCGGSGAWRITVKASTRKNGKAVGPRQLFKCKACKRQFSVTTGSIFEDSKIALRTWLTVMYRMCSSKKGVSACQIEREFGLSHEAAWFMLHRVRHVMDEQTGMLSGVIEADETYIGGKPRGHYIDRSERYKRPTITASGLVAYNAKSKAKKEMWDKKAPVFGILERGGRVRAMALPRPTAQNVRDALLANVDFKASRLITDESRLYYAMGKDLPHDVIRHRSEYVRGEIHTQGIEGFWSLLKRGLIGVYHHVDAGYLNQYVNEFAFRYNRRRISDQERFASLVKNVEGKRLDWYFGQTPKVSEPKELDEPFDS